MQEELESKGSTQAKAFGNSMLPIIESGSLLTFVKEESYEVGDIVFCKVAGNFIDAHKITQKSEQKGYLISNNKGRNNGWTRQVYGRVTKAVFPKGTVRHFPH
jgi:SOS-response transcriptional repressor LexA